MIILQSGRPVTVAAGKVRSQQGIFTVIMMVAAGNVRLAGNDVVCLTHQPGIPAHRDCLAGQRSES